jgi:large subunit ribosomal protein L15
MPLQRRLPKRGFRNLFRKEWTIVNVKDLSRFPAGAVVDAEALRAAGLVKKVGAGIKILGDGMIDHALTVRAHHYSLAAKRKIEAAGGKAEVI